MKVVIKSICPPINVLGTCDLVEVATPGVRQVYIDDRRAPPALETIILAGIDSLVCDYALELIQRAEDAL